MRPYFIPQVSPVRRRGSELVTGGGISPPATPSPRGVDPKTPSGRQDRSEFDRSAAGEAGVVGRPAPGGVHRPAGVVEVDERVEPARRVLSGAGGEVGAGRGVATGPVEGRAVGEPGAVVGELPVASGVEQPPTPCAAGMATGRSTTPPSHRWLAVRSRWGEPVRLSPSCVTSWAHRDTGIRQQLPSFFHSRGASPVGSTTPGTASAPTERAADFTQGTAGASPLPLVPRAPTASSIGRSFELTDVRGGSGSGSQTSR
jgi:hypothetical protein